MPDRAKNAALPSTSASIFWVARRANESGDVKVFRLASPGADAVGCYYVDAGLALVTAVAPAFALLIAVSPERPRRAALLISLATHPPLSSFCLFSETPPSCKGLTVAGEMRVRDLKHFFKRLRNRAHQQKQKRAWPKWFTKRARRINVASRLSPLGGVAVHSDVARLQQRRLLRRGRRRCQLRYERAPAAA